MPMSASGGPRRKRVRYADDTAVAVTAVSPRVLAVQRVYQALRDRIVGGEILPGMHLVEGEVTAEYGVSRGTVREALRRLSADELVDVIPHRGARVRRLTQRDVEELYVVREAIECVAARLAAEGPRDHLAELREIYEEAERLTQDRDRIRLTQLGVRFHQTVARMSGNSMLHSMLARLNTQMIGYQFLWALDTVEVTTSQREHAEIIAALAHRDGQRAEATMRRHMASTRASLLRAMGPSLRH
jgi:DNA-binding GntR family transcriptional regulator